MDGELRPGDLLADRYTLQARVAAHHGSEMWRAFDEVLARLVAVRVYQPTDDAAAERFLIAAALAGRLSHPNVARVYDAAQSGTACYVVSEWVDGPALADLLADGPLPPREAAAVTADVAEAIAAAHTRGLTHGRLHTGNVLLARSGQTKLTDAEVAAAIAGDADMSDPDEDLVGIGRLLYAALTARWPGDVAWAAGLPPPPYRGRQLCAPRQVRAGLPRDLDSIAMRLLAGEFAGSPPLDTPTSIAAALADYRERGGADLPPRSRLAWRVLRIAIPLTLIGGIGAAGWLAGLAVGRVPGPAANFPNLAAGNGQKPGQRVTAVRIAGIAAYDPPPGDGQEDSDQVPLAHDGDLSTAWQTERYNNANFGGLKQGVGLIIDLGQPTAVKTVAIALTNTGADVELRAGNTVASSAASFTLVAQQHDAHQTVKFTLSSAKPARYWVIWLTRLPHVSGGYREGIAEIAFTS